MTNALASVFGVTIAYLLLDTLGHGILTRAELRDAVQWDIMGHSPEVISILSLKSMLKMGYNLFPLKHMQKESCR